MTTTFPLHFTLLISNLLPFGYFASACGGKFSFLVRSGKANAAFACLSVALILGSGRMLFMLEPGTAMEQRLLVFLHMAPALLTLQMIRHFRTERVIERLATGRGRTDETSASYLPKPLNAQVERISWDDIIISPEVKNELQLVISLLKDPEQAKRYGIDPPKGVLLEGPPGTGKTTLAKVIAKNAGLSFFALQMDEVVSKWVGDSEKNLSALFGAAKKHAPSVIFMDEVESIGRTRSGSSSSWSDNLLNHLLQLMDGIVGCKGVYIIAATNRADLIDPALLRPGRLHKAVTIPLPNTANRKRIFNLYLQKSNFSPEIDVDYLALRTRNCSGADIEAIYSQAGMNALKRESVLLLKERTSTILSEDLIRALVEYTGCPSATINQN